MDETQNINFDSVKDTILRLMYEGNSYDEAQYGFFDDDGKEFNAKTERAIREELIEEQVLEYKILNQGSSIRMPHSDYVLTQKGLSVAREGYLNYRNRLQREESEKRQREKEVHQALLDSAEAAQRGAEAAERQAITAKRAFWLSIGSLLISIFAFVVSIYSPSKVMPGEKKISEDTATAIKPAFEIVQGDSTTNTSISDSAIKK